MNMITLLKPDQTNNLVGNSLAAVEITETEHLCLCFQLTPLHCRYFKKPLNIMLGFIPEIVFMSSLFGYLVLLVFYKWTAYDAYTSKDAPSLLIHFINMCLFNYNDPTNKPLYRGQVLPSSFTPLPLPAFFPSLMHMVEP